MSAKEAYEKKLQAQIDEWQADIAKLEAKAGKASADTQIEYHRRVDELKKKKQAAQEKLDDVRQSSEDAWEDLKSGADMAVKSLGQAVKSAAARFG